MNYAYENPGEFGGKNRFIPVDPIVIDNLLENHEGAIAVQFFPDWVEM